MALVTLATLRTRALERADMENSSFVATSTLNTWINSAADELYQLLAEKFESQLLKSASFSTVANTETVALPTDFFRMVGVDLVVNSRTRTLDPFNIHERNVWRNRGPPSFLLRDVPKYWVRGAVMALLPVVDAVYAGTYWYVPVRTAMSGDSDTLDGVLGWEEYVVVEVAIRCLQKEESDPSVLMAEKAALKLRIEEASERDGGGPITITNINRPEWEYP